MMTKKIKEEPQVDSGKEMTDEERQKLLEADIASLQNPGNFRFQLLLSLEKIELQLKSIASSIESLSEEVEDEKD